MTEDYDIFSLGYDRNLIRYSAFEEGNLEMTNLFTDSVPASAVGALPGGKTLNDIGDVAYQDEITDIINARINTQSATILADWTFGESGALVMKEDETSGLWITPTGILAKKNNVNTVTITNEGDATFGGALSAVTGTLGTLEIAAGGHIRQGQVAHASGSGFWLGEDGGTTKFSVGRNRYGLVWDGLFFKISGCPNFGNFYFQGGFNDGLIETITGTGAIDRYLYATEMQVSAADSTVSLISPYTANSAGSDDRGYFAGMDILLGCSVVCEGNDEETIVFVGIGDGVPVNTTTYTGNHIGFYIKYGPYSDISTGYGAVYTTNGDGSAQTITETKKSLRGGASKIIHEIRITNKSAKLQFYLRGDLIAEHSTNLPTATVPYKIEMKMKNNSTKTSNLYIDNNYQISITSIIMGF